MFDKMKALMDMQKKMQELKRKLENTIIEVISSNGLVKISMAASQEVREVSVQKDIQHLDKAELEKAIKDAYNKALKRSQEIAAQEMKDITGMSLPGL